MKKSQNRIVCFASLFSLLFTLMMILGKNEKKKKAPIYDGIIIHKILNFHNCFFNFFAFVPYFGNVSTKYSNFCLHIYHI